jgi:hypothetical protein
MNARVETPRVAKCRVLLYREEFHQLGGGERQDLSAVGVHVD